MKKGSKPRSGEIAATAARVRRKKVAASASTVSTASASDTTRTKTAPARPFVAKDSAGNYHLTPRGAMHGALRRVFGSNTSQEQTNQVYELMAEWAATEVMVQYLTDPATNNYAGIVFTEQGSVIGVTEDRC